MLLTIDKLINVLSCAEGVTPDLHLKRNLQLMIAELQHLLKRIFLIKLDGEGDLGLDQELGVLGLLDDLVEVVVKGFSYAGILKAVPILGTEVEDSGGSLVVEVDHLRVLSEGVEDDLANLNEKGDASHQVLLLLNRLVVAVGQNHELLGVQLVGIT
jgi:hypothetical protein